MKHIILYFSSLSFLFFASQNVFAQETHCRFKNFSFEDLPRPGIAPMGWFSYDFAKESPPDIHPATPPAFGVKNKPYHGKTYLGLVTRANKTFESVTQLLTEPLVKNECYSFSIYLAQSPTYKSTTTWAKDEVMDFTYPTILNIWGGHQKDEEIELLVSTPSVNHSDWKKYTLTFTPSKKINHLIFEVYYPNPEKPTNGHLLLDNLSPIINITCETEDGIVKPTTNNATTISKQLELLTAIQEHGYGLSFDSKNKLTDESRISLKKIGSILYNHPTQKLILYHRSKNRKEKIARRNNIHVAMKEIGYANEMYEILTVNRDLIRKQLVMEDTDIIIEIEKK